MTPPPQNNGGSPVVPTNIAELMVTVARIEVLVTPIASMAVRLTAAESAIIRLEAKQKPSVTFLQVITIIALCVTIIVGVSGLVIAKDERASQQVQLEILKQSNTDLTDKVTP